MSTVPLYVSIVNIDVDDLVPGSMLVTQAVRFGSTNSVPVDVGGRASRWPCRSFYTWNDGVGPMVFQIANSAVDQ